MKINDIWIQNFRGINELNLDVNKRGMIFFGINGAGKSTLLDAIAMNISRVLYKAMKLKTKQFYTFSEQDLKLGEKKH